MERKDSLPTILFLDEIHRFTKSQQDVLLPYVESGIITLIGATTENPSFALTNALLSRARVIVFPSLSYETLSEIVAKGSQALGIQSKDEQATHLLIQYAGGDARRVLQLLERMAVTGEKEITVELLQTLHRFGSDTFYDRSGEEHYNTISAFIKSLRASKADAALFWGFKMIESGEDPRFVFRRMIIFASEDIGNADPNALRTAVAGLQAYEFVGLPEGKIPLAHVITYLASAPKSNRSYVAMHRAIDAVKKNPRAEVSFHLRNAPTKLMKNLGYGKEYLYPHDHEENELEGVEYLPKGLEGQVFYEPKESGAEAKILANRKKK